MRFIQGINNRKIIGWEAHEHQAGVGVQADILGGARQKLNVELNITQVIDIA